MSALTEAPFHVSFPHGAAHLRVLMTSAPCPKCGRAVVLVVVPIDAPETAACLACTGPSSPVVRTSGKEQHP